MKCAFLNFDIFQAWFAPPVYRRARWFEWIVQKSELIRVNEDCQNGQNFLQLKKFPLKIRWAESEGFEITNTTLLSTHLKFHSAERDGFEVTHTTLLSLSMVPSMLTPLLYALWSGNRSVSNPSFFSNLSKFLLVKFIFGYQYLHLFTL